MAERPRPLPPLDQGRVWEKIVAELVEDHDNKYRMLHIIIVCVHQQAAAGKRS
ncbi:hypothetical protein [Shinella sp.]|jgi:hypothetical protein|uniref:hypothetical protein n=1 Tax=Shinella sp. TaxID=1870904 RepID=UPI0029A72DE3|nr:hypothetical protein [Shinella sp.]MDX3977666.1 hypothetical protein [Shinella sp.]